MKILDATSIIAFISEMNSPDTLERLSNSYTIVIPKGVYSEITKQPGKDTLSKLVNKNVIKIVEVDSVRTEEIQNEYPQLHLGECEVIAFAELQHKKNKCYIITDDGIVRKKFNTFNYSWTEQLLDFMRQRNLIDEILYNNLMDSLSKSPFFSRGKRYGK